MSKIPVSVSIVCVYNKLAVRKECLDRSIEALASERTDIEYLPIENVDGTYSSAGAALNYGVSLAKNDVIVFVHQDVYLHSLVALKEAAGQMQSAGFGLLGAVGMRSDRRLIGRIRDRVLLAGDLVSQPTEVDSVDEVLFMVPRAQLLSEPLIETPDLAWHAYAVEYGLRMRRKGLRVGVANVPLTHNSLSVNIERLDKAHQAVARKYADLLPVRTTCGTITEEITRNDRQPWLQTHRWRYRWLLDSMVLQSASRSVANMPAILADMRHDIDDVIERAPERRLYIINCIAGHPFAEDRKKPLNLSRRDGSVFFFDCGLSDIPKVLTTCPPGSWTLITNLTDVEIKLLETQMSLPSGVLGYHHDIGFWLLLGPTLAALPESWQARRATPLRPRALVGMSLFR